MRREPTLIFDEAVLARNVGFTSPWPARLRLWLMGLTGRAREVEYATPTLYADGWITDHAQYVTRVRSRSVNDSTREKKP